MKTIEQFYEQLKTDPELQKKLTAAEAQITGDDPRAAFEQILPVIREAGYEFSFDELEAYAKEHQPNPDGEMSLDELDAVAGGGICILFGYSKAEGERKSSVCFWVGDGPNLLCSLIGG